MKRGGAERGEAAIVICLAVLMVIVIVAMTMTLASTTAQLTERARYDLDRAKLNARNGLVDADEWMEETLSETLRAVLADVAARNLDLSGPALASMEFPEYERRFQMGGTYDTEDDFADVKVAVTLAGAPIRRSPSGAAVGSSPLLIDEYRFNAHLVSKGHSRGAQASFEQDLLVVVQIEVAPEP